MINLSFFEKKKNKNPLEEYLTDYQVKAIFRAINRKWWNFKLRDTAIFALIFDCFLKPAEIWKIKIKYFDFETRELKCLRNQGSPATITRLKPSTYNILGRYIYDLKEKKPTITEERNLFLSQENKKISRKTLDYLMKKYWKVAKISENKRNLKTLRNTWIFNYIKENNIKKFPKNIWTSEKFLLKNHIKNYNDFLINKEKEE